MCVDLKCDYSFLNPLICVYAKLCFLGKVMVENGEDDKEVKTSQHEDSSHFSDIFELWRDPPQEENTVVVPGVAEIITPRTLPHVLNDLLYTEMRTADMTNLGNILLGYPTESDPVHDDSQVGRLSLAHENLSYMPKLVYDEFGPYVKILDITNNNIKNLDFLEHFTELTSLIADKNPINSIDTNLPWMPKLELLYLNHCKIDNLYWIETLRYNCPNLKYLSLMGNPVVPSFMTQGNIYQYLQYRLYVISLIPTLIHLDDKKIANDERIEANKMFPTPFVQNFFKKTKARLPHYFRSITHKMNDYFSLPPKGSSKSNERNLIV